MGINAHPNGVAAELEKILSSQSFANASQGSRLLRFVVERTLEGRAEEIKESVLGVEVFGRPSFDPRTDPIARVEASRLRQKLAKYYESEGKQDAIRIHLPKGSYVPIFEPVVEQAASRAVTSRSRREHLAWAIAGLFAAVALALALGYLRRPTQDVEVRKLSVLPPAQAGFLSQPANISPDGRLLVFAAAVGSQALLWIRPLNSLDAWALLGTEEATYPFWSPDSRSVGFFARGKLKRVDIASGAVQTLCDAENGRGGAWNRDGVIVFCPRETSILYRVPASGGTPQPLTEFDVSRQEAAHRWPQFLPDGKRFIFLARSRRLENQAIYLGKLDSRDRIRLLPARSNAAWAQLGRQTGILVYVREGSVFGQRIDTSRFQAVGEPFPLAGPVGSGFDRADFSVSENGVLTYSLNAGAVTEQLLWRDRGGRQIGSVRSVSSPGPQYVNPSLSPDGRMLATAILDWDAMMFSLWLFDQAHGVPSRFTFEQSAWAVWSPDGKQIAFSLDRKEGHADLYVKESSGSSAERLLLASGVSKTPTDWSPDGKFLLFYQPQPKMKRDVWVLPLSGEAKPFPILETAADEYGARFSPDGRWIAYTSDESGREEVYVQSFPVGGGKRKISHQGGSWPVWRRDGNELFYISADRQVMAAALADKASFTFDLPKPLFPATRGRVSGFSVTADGQRFLMNMRNDEKQSAPVTVVINWSAGIR